MRRDLCRSRRNQDHLRRHLCPQFGVRLDCCDGDLLEMGSLPRPARVLLRLPQRNITRTQLIRVISFGDAKSQNLRFLCAAAGVLCSSASLRYYYVTRKVTFAIR